MTPTCRSTLIIMAFFTATSLAGAQQPNTPEASMTWAGKDGPPWPIVSTVFAEPGGTLTLQVEGAPNQPYLVTNAPAGLLAAGFPLTGIGILDQDLSGGLDVLLNGFAPATLLDPFANTGALGVSTWTIPTPGTTGNLSFGLQAFMSDPASSSGFSLTAATDLTLSPALTASGIHVSATTGAPGNPGTAAAPVQTITEGIALALAAGAPFPQVSVANGTYAESPVFLGGISVQGGFHPASWTLNPSGGATIVAVDVDSGPPPTIENTAVATTISHLQFIASDATIPGTSSIAFEVRNVSFTVVFESCEFIAGNGAPGIAGLSGSPGAPGTVGGEAGPTGYNTSAVGLGAPGPVPGAGGDGGAGATQMAGTNGLPGQMAPGGGGAGGAGGQGGYSPMVVNVGPLVFYVCSGMGGGGAGAGGSIGSTGLHGAPGSASDGTVVSGAWVPGAAATGGSGGLGGDGTGGGGGGGGGAAAVGTPIFGFPIIHGGHGGGGGGGGAPGSAGLGGEGGGASIALFNHNAVPVFQNCLFVAGDGGSGGAAGDGGAGGAGGAGGFGSFDPTCSGTPDGQGGDGGPGGWGGTGGAGAGGAGGPSFCVFWAADPCCVPNSSLSFGSTFITGAGGVGGAGGMSNGSQAQSGPSGPVGAIVTQ